MITLCIPMGDGIHSAIYRAIQRARRENTSVRFRFNHVVVICEPYSDPELVYQRWASRIPNTRLYRNEKMVAQL